MFSNFFGTKLYQDDEKLKLSEVNELLKSDTQANFHWKKANNLALVGGISALANLGFVVIELTDNKPFENTDNNTVNLIGYLGTFAATIVFSSLSKSEAKKSVLAYNQALEKKTAFKLGPSEKGIGIAVTF
ncbi:MAG: hypothetical protein ABJN84_10875 [Flavobacteriaceae bacterium]